MIPRTSIDEANRHLNALHKKVNDLEKTVREQNESLISKDEYLKQRLSEVESAKNIEVTKLTEKIAASEKTVDILQEQLRQKHQHVAALQRSCRLMQNLVSLKPHLKELFLCLEEAEKDVASQKDILSLYSAASSPVRNCSNSASKSSNYVNSEAINSYANHVGEDEEMDGVESGDNVWKVRQGRSSSKEEKKKGKGKEFYL